MNEVREPDGVAVRFFVFWKITFKRAFLLRGPKSLVQIRIQL